MPEVFPFGLFIKRIEQTKTSDESGGENIFTVELTDHSRRQFKVRNGAKGDTGDAAGIKEITASIDNGIGVPSVTVTSTGTGVEKTVHFDFKNLKGETGNVALTEEVKQHISQSVASANQYTDDAIKGVSQSIDAGDTDTLQAAKKYTDQNAQAETQARVQADANMLADAKRYINDLLIKIFQNGYIQWPGMPSPLEDTTLHFEGYSWYEVFYRGNFFRAKGDNAKAFSSKRLTKEQIKNGDYIFQDDEQQDAIRDIRGVFGSDSQYQPNIFSANSVSKIGCFEATEKPTMSGAPSKSTAAGNGNIAGWTNIKFRASRVVPTAEENRSRNLTFIVWVLVKDE